MLFVWVYRVYLDGDYQEPSTYMLPPPPMVEEINDCKCLIMWYLSLDRLQNRDRPVSSFYISSMYMLLVSISRFIIRSTYIRPDRSLAAGPIYLSNRLDMA